MQTGQGPTVNITNTGVQTVTVGGGALANTVTVNGTAQSDAITVARTAATDTVTVNALQAIGLTTADTQALVVNTGLGTDTVNVSGSAGPASLTVNGQASPAADRLTVTNATAGITTTLVPGTTPDAGTVQGPDGNVGFTGMRTVGLTGAGAGNTLVGQGTNADDNLALQFLGGANRFWVNSQAVVDFTDFATVTLNGLFGNDTFSVSPVGLVGVTAINANGNDGNDSVTVNGSAGADAITVTPTGPTAATVAIAGSAPVAVATTEAVAVNGGGGGDALTVAVPAAANVAYTPGATPDAASVQVNSLVPLSFSNLGAGGSVALSSGGAGGSALTYSGTPAADTFTAAATTGAVTLNAQLPVTPTGFSALTLNGVTGDDTFNATGPLPYTTTTLLGNDPTGSDVANLTGDGTDPVAVNLGATPPTVTGGGLGTVALSGVDTLNLNAGGGAVTVNGTPGPDAFSVTPTGAASSTTTLAGLNLAVNTTTTGTFTVDPGAGNDTVTVNGTAAGDTIGVVRGAPTAVTVSPPGGPLQTVNVVTADTRALVVDTGLGSDTVNVSGTSGPASLTVNGGADPRLDTLNVTNGSAGTTTVAPGATPDAGTIVEPGTDGSVNFTGMTSVSVTAAGAASANTIVGIGPNGNDTLFLQHVGSPTPAGSDRIWVNNQAPASFSGFGTVTLRGLFGNDQFNVNPVALAAAVTAINVNGTSDGNALTVNGSSAADAATFAPTGAAAGSVSITTPAGTAPTTFTAIQAVTYNGQGGNDTLTVQGPTGADTVSYSSGPAVDQGAALVNNLVPLTFSGLGAAGGVVIGTADQEDTLHYSGNAGNDTFTVNVPGDTVSEDGDVPVSLPGVATLSLDGQGGGNAAVFNGSAAAQGFTLEPSAAGKNSFALLHTLGTVTNIGGTNIGEVDINTLGGADALTVADLSGSGIGLVNLALSPADAVSLNGTPGGDSVHVAVTGAGTITATGLPALVNVTGGSAAAGDTLTVNGGDGNDTIEVTPAVSALAAVTVNGGPGNDTLFAAGTIIGGGGQDTLDLSCPPSSARPR